MGYFLIGEEDNQKCYVLKNLMFSKNIDYIYIDKDNLKTDVLEYLEKTNENYPMVLEVKNFSSFQEMLSFFRT